MRKTWQYPYPDEDENERTNQQCATCPQWVHVTEMILYDNLEICQKCADKFVEEDAGEKVPLDYETRHAEYKCQDCPAVLPGNEIVRLMDPYTNIHYFCPGCGEKRKKSHPENWR